MLRHRCLLDEQLSLISLATFLQTVQRACRATTRTVSEACELKRKYTSKCVEDFWKRKLWLSAEMQTTVLYLRVTAAKTVLRKLLSLPYRFSPLKRKETSEAKKLLLPMMRRKIRKDITIFPKFKTAVPTSLIVLIPKQKTVLTDVEEMILSQVCKDWWKRTVEERSIKVDGMRIWLKDSNYTSYRQKLAIWMKGGSSSEFQLDWMEKLFHTMPQSLAIKQNLWKRRPDVEILVHLKRKTNNNTAWVEKNQAYRLVLTLSSKSAALCFSWNVWQAHERTEATTARLQELKISSRSAWSSSGYNQSQPCGKRKLSNCCTWRDAKNFQRFYWVNRDLLDRMQLQTLRSTTA